MTNLNLLSPTITQRQSARQLLRTWAYVFGLAMLLAIGWTVYEEYRTDLTQQRHDALALAYESTHERLQNVRHLRSELNNAQSQQASLLDANNQQLLTLLGLFSSAARQNSQGVAIERFQYDLGDLRHGSSSFRVELRGIAAGTVALAEFVAVIRSWDLFQEVELKSSGEVNVGDAPARQYVVECIH